MRKLRGDRHKQNGAWLDGWFDYLYSRHEKQVLRYTDHVYHQTACSRIRPGSTDSDEQFTSYEAQIDYYTRSFQEHSEWTFLDRLYR